MGNIWRNIALVKVESKLTGSEQGGKLEFLIHLPLRKEGDVCGLERRSMRSGEAIVGGMMVA